jgi:hypothetical protein
MRGTIPRKDRFAAIRCGLSGLCVDHGQCGSYLKFLLADYPDGGNSNAFLATVQSDLHELV